jgi:hypothetical protein
MPLLIVVPSIVDIAPPLATDRQPNVPRPPALTITFRALAQQR